MGELVLPVGLLEQLLPTFDSDAFARQIAPMLDAGDRQAAERAWAEFADRANRVLTRKKVMGPVRKALLRELSSAVRLAILLHRGTTRLGPVAAKDRPAPSLPSAEVVQFRARAGGAS
jgi:hypothetical protein